MLMGASMCDHWWQHWQENTSRRQIYSVITASGGHNFNDRSVLRLLIEHGADINLQNRFCTTPLQWASYNGALEVVRLLLEQGADVEAKDEDGKTALQQAGDRGHDEIVKLLREHGAK
ncbi:ankyrin repeat-containing domain protein [Russula emetica]|nr:ankyrin repeat-containing domain protein [Russula emetica]